MGSDLRLKRDHAVAACDRCKKNKQGCTKTRPICARCARLGVRCTYSKRVDPVRVAQAVTILPTFPPTPPPSSWGSPAIIGIDEHVSIQALELLNSITSNGAGTSAFSEVYFSTFHKSLPIIDPDYFYVQLGVPQFMSSHFLVLLCSMALITRLSSRSEATTELSNEVFQTVRGMYSLLQSMGNVSIELVQSGIIIASYEHCQALGQDAWFSIGTCARMAHILGLHRTIKENVHAGDDRIDTKRNVWWSIVVLERAIASEYEYNNLSFASEWPDLDDFLPLPAADDGTPRRVSDDLVLPHMVIDGWPDLFKREFTRMSKFQSVIQATYLSGLVIKYIMAKEDDPVVRDIEAQDLDIALHSFCSALIPPPEYTEGRYCGAYGIRTTATLALYLHRLSVGKDTGRPEIVSASIIALQDLARAMTLSAKSTAEADPADFDARTFWTHTLFAKAALIHVKYSVRDLNWAGDLDELKKHLQYFAPRYKIHDNYLRQIESVELDPIERGICPCAINMNLEYFTPEILQELTAVVA